MSQYIQEEKAARKKAWKEGKNVELPGRGKSTIEQIREQYGDDSNSGIVVPLAPFGIPKYDQGERFDLQAREQRWWDTNVTASLGGHGSSPGGHRHCLPGTCGTRACCWPSTHQAGRRCL